MSSIFLRVLLGFSSGAYHSITGADHLATVSVIVTETHSIKKVLRVACSWAIGHTISLFLAFLFIYFAHVSIGFQNSVEAVIGFILIGLALMRLVKIIKARGRAVVDHAHEEIHSADPLQHHHEDEDRRSANHSHDHQPSRTEIIRQTFSHSHAHSHLKGEASFTLRPLMIGIVHGLAGSAVVDLLVANSIHDFWFGIVYITLFGAGCVIAMSCAALIAATPHRLMGTSQKLKVLSSCLTYLFIAIALWVGAGMIREHYLDLFTSLQKLVS